MRILPAAALAAALVLPQSALAAAADVGDVRCLLTMFALQANGAQAKNPQQEAQAAMGAYFFMARITTRDPGYDFATRLKPEAEKMNLGILQAEASRCRTILTSAAQRMRAGQQSLSSVTPKP